MGMGGHILGEKKLRALNRATGMDFDRAARRGQWVSARRVADGKCEHYEGKWGEALTLDEKPMHWSSCP